MVRAQKNLLDFLGIKKLHAIVGGSMGGMQALQWIVEFPGFVEKALIIAATARHIPKPLPSTKSVGVRSAGICLEVGTTWTGKVLAKAWRLLA